MIAPKAEPPLMTPEQAARVLERVIYEQVAACIDFELLAATEQELCFALCDVGVDTDDVEALATHLIDTALDNVKRDVRRTVDVRSSPLAGMDCELCEEEARTHQVRTGPAR